MGVLGLTGTRGTFIKRTRTDEFALVFPFSFFSTLLSTFFDLAPRAPLTSLAHPRFYEHEAALAAIRSLSSTKLDDRPIRADLDWGFAEGRQYGRARTGGQVRDEFRTDFDPGRGGWGGRSDVMREMRGEMIRDVYRDFYTEGVEAPMGAPAYQTRTGYGGNQRFGEGFDCWRVVWFSCV